MYVRVSHSTFDPAKRTEVDAVTEEAGEVLAGLPGFVRYVGAADDGSGMGVVISFWESEEAAGFDRAAFGDVMSRLAASGLALQPPQVFKVDVDRSSSAS